MKDLFSVQEVAKLLDMSHSGILYHIKNGTLKSTQVGKIYVITKEDFADFLKDKKKEKNQNKNLTSRYCFNFASEKSSNSCLNFSSSLGLTPEISLIQQQ